MGRVNAFWQDAREARWQTHFDDYCLNEFGGRNPTGSDYDDACQYANDMMDEEDARVDREPYVPSPEYAAWCAEIDSARTTVVHGDPLRHRRAA